MKKNLAFWQFSGFVFTSVLGSLLHFLYGWTNENAFIATFSAVNESTWEHLKLFFFPAFIFSLIQYRFFKYYDNFWCIKLIGILLGLILIPVLFYTYNGAVGKSPDWLNIVLFFLVCAISFLAEWFLFKKNTLCCKKPLLAFMCICLIGILFAIFTFWTPKFAIFKDPVTEKYGIQKGCTKVHPFCITDIFQLFS